MKSPHWAVRRALGTALALASLLGATSCAQTLPSRTLTMGDLADIRNAGSTNAALTPTLPSVPAKAIGLTVAVATPTVPPTFPPTETASLTGSMGYFEDVNDGKSDSAPVIKLPDPTSTGPSVPLPTRTTTPNATTATPASPARLKLDMDAIFPPGEGRDLVIYNCQTCHSFVRIVAAQRPREAWTLVKRKMRPNVPGLTDEQADILFAYLAENFNDTKPAPDLPLWYKEQ